MSITKYEQDSFDEPDGYDEQAEFGGPLQDGQDRDPVEYVSLEGGFNIRQGSLSGKMKAPTSMAPLTLAIVATIVGGAIWAMGAWQAGLAVMLVSLLMCGFSIFRQKK